MNKLTYLLGAGASANAISTVTEFNTGLTQFGQYLSFTAENDKTGWDPRLTVFRDDLLTLIKNIEDVVHFAKGHETIDTLARKYFLQGDIKRYNNIKVVLSAYFLFCQVFSGDISQFASNNQVSHFNIDKRFDSLFAQKLERTEKGNIIANSNFNIVTWNYDLQIEFALKNYLLDYPINRIKSEFQIHPNRDSLDLQNGPIFNPNDFYAVKLNGNAFFDFGHLNGLKITIYDKLFSRLTNSGFLTHDYVLGELLETISQVNGYSSGGESTFLKYFNFSWESVGGEIPIYRSKSQIMNEIVDSISKSDILIVVGYSFPNFNHNTDLKLFSKSNFKKIIIQDKNPEVIKSRLLSLIPQFQQKEHKGNIHPHFEFHPIGPYFPIEY